MEDLINDQTHASEGIGPFFHFSLIGWRQQAQSRRNSSIVLISSSLHASWRAVTSQAERAIVGSTYALDLHSEGGVEGRTIEPKAHAPAALAQLDRLDEARSAVRVGLSLNPAYTISRRRASWTAQSDDPTYLAQFESIFEGMRKAGVPEQ